MGQRSSLQHLVGGWGRARRVLGGVVNGERPVTAAELDAHLTPMREDISTLVSDQREFAEFMTGAIVSRAIQEKVLKSRHFWLGFALSATVLLVTAAGVIINLSSRIK